MDACPICGKGRYKLDGKTPKKRFYYLPLIPRLQRWFMIKSLSDLLSKHDLRGSIWDDLFHAGGPLAGDKRNLALALCVDGFDPFNHLHISYSMTPVLIKCMNLPPYLRDRIGMLMLSTLIPGTYSKGYHKTLYTGSRRFLPPNSPLRKGEIRERPEIRSRMGQLALGAEVEALPPAKRQKRATEVGKKGVEIISKLHWYSYMEYPVEAMHTIQVVAKKIFKVLTGKDINMSTQIGENEFGRPFSAQNVSLSKTQLRCADERLLQVFVPKHHHWRPKQAIFTNTPYMTCHDWKELITLGILKYAVKGCLGNKHEKTLFMFLDVLSDLLAYNPPEGKEFDKLEERTHEALSLMERDFPLCIQTLCTHLIHHLPQTIAKCGPLVNSWMYSFERFMSFLKRRILNRTHPEATSVEAYRPV
ncbi:uncharacterized protein [Diadema antillarum]|uniref:uncharacterized protein n=1 Tax=Diadema antillarum TaxID=105358 RepID=UPI003A8B3963